MTREGGEGSRARKIPKNLVQFLLTDDVPINADVPDRLRLRPLERKFCDVEKDSL